MDLDQVEQLLDRIDAIHVRVMRLEAEVLGVNMTLASLRRAVAGLPSEGGEGEGSAQGLPGAPTS